MDLDPIHSAQYGSPTAVFQNINSLLDASGAWDPALVKSCGDDGSDVPWALSHLNPAARICSLVPLSFSIWRIDGSQNAGRRYYAWPSGSQPSVPPLRADVWIPAPSTWPTQLRAPLQASANVHTRGKAVTQLGITQHVLRALDYWSSSIPKFDVYYRTLPFGSRIVIKNIAVMIEEMNISVEKSVEECELLTIPEMHSVIRLPSGRSLPASKDLADFELLLPFSETVSLVRFRKDRGDPVTKQYIMKASIEFSQRIYSELKVLLALPNHPHLVRKPVHLVTSRRDVGGKNHVVGFVLEYHAGGSLQNVLALEHCHLQFHWTERLLWAKQITSTLLFLNEVTKIGYSEIKTDNMVLSGAADGTRNVVLIDFECHGAGDIWTAPELGHLENLRSIIRGSESSSAPKKYTLLWEKLYTKVPLFSNKFEDDLAGAVEIENFSILSLEAVQVFRLGLVLYCIFEGVGWPKIRISSSSTSESAQEFPRFRQTPPSLQRLILNCTEGAREHDGDALFLVRRGNKIYPHNMTSHNVEPVPTKADVIIAARAIWLRAADSIEVFFAAKERYDMGMATVADLTHLSYLRRPKLRDVLAILDRLLSIGIF